MSAIGSFYKTLMKLYYAILGATPTGRNIEQHDVFFGIAEDFQDLFPEMKAFWSNAKIHVDCYMELKYVDGYEVKITDKIVQNTENQLFFINLGGYKPGCFEEFHKQHIVVAKSMGEAIQRAKRTEFYKTMSFKGAESHVDEKYGVDIDDIFKVTDILPKKMKEEYSISLEKSHAENQQNFTKIGYLKLK